ncbi:MAG: DUF3787 domain-containing protein [Tissierellia bacterium]|nr:DUF3787 domain-containing protein [Tissierellia bacterium]
MNRDNILVRKISNPNPYRIYHHHMEPSIQHTNTDIYYRIKSRLAGTKVAIPTEDSIMEAKRWVDDINRK